jgi:hypothetical protein
MNKHSIIKFANSASQETGQLLVIGATPEAGYLRRKCGVQNNGRMGREFVIFVTGVAVSNPHPE